MAFVSTAEQAIVQLSGLMKDSSNPHDRGFVVNMGRAVLGAVAHLKNLVETSGGKAQKGTVTITIKLHAFRDPNKEFRCKPSVHIGNKLPSEFFAHEGEFYVDDEGNLSTSPIARTQEKLPGLTVVELDGAPTQPKAERKAGKAI